MAIIDFGGTKGRSRHADRVSDGESPQSTQK